MSRAETDAQHSVTLCLFGYPKLYQKERPLDTTLPKKALALLAYVAVADEPIGRETAETLLWPDVPTKTAKSSLRNLLSKLRKALPHLLKITSRTITLHPNAAQQIDVVAFQRGIAAIQRAHGTQKSLDLHHWQATLDRYQGDFLAGFHIPRSAPFDEWSVLQREYLREQAITNLFSLSDAYAAAAEIDLALAALTRLLAIEPWHEAAYLQQLQLLHASGRRTEALQLYERFQMLLADEFALEPSTELTALYQQIKTGTTTPLGTHRSSKTPTFFTRTESVTDNAVAGASIPTNLPHPLRLFFGREKELTLIQQLITNPTCRLLTIVGAGGMGKTTLAEEAGLRLLKAPAVGFSDGIFFVALSGIKGNDNQQAESNGGGQAAAIGGAGQARPTHQEAIALAIAKQIGCEIQQQIPLVAQLQAYLHPKRLLLILDNFEHLLAGTGTLMALLTRAPELRLIVTSRFVLGIQGETVLSIEKLSLPSAVYLPQAERPDLAVAMQQTPVDPLKEAQLLQESEAAAMLVQRIQRHDPRFVLNAQNIGAVAQICHLVGGLPLGIELAASLSPVLGCTALAAELTEGLDVLALESPDLPAEQRSLWAVFMRSWQLLMLQEQHLLAQLSLFPGSFDRSAASAITEASLPLLLQLINYSLLERVDEERYAMHRTIRAFARKQLQQWPDLAEAAQVRFVRYYLAFFGQQLPTLQGKEHATAVARIFVELDNIQMAWRWAATRRMSAELLDCAGALMLFQEAQGIYAVASELYQYALHQFGVQHETDTDWQGAVTDVQTNRLIGRLQSYIGTNYTYAGQIAKAQTIFRSSFAHLQRADAPAETSFCLVSWGVSARGLDLRQAKALAMQAMPLLPNVTPYYETLVYTSLGETNRMLGVYDEAERFMTDAYQLAKRIDWSWGLTNSHRLLGQLQLSRGHYAAAESHLRNCIKLARERHLQTLLAEATIALGYALQWQERLVEAEECYLESLQLTEKLQLNAHRTQVLWARGSLAEQQGEYAAAKAFFRDSLAVGDVVRANRALPTLGWALIGLGEWAEAQAYFQQVSDEAEQRHAHPIQLDAQVGLTYLQYLRAQQAVQPDQTQLTAILRVLRTIHQHPAATQETHRRVAHVTAMFDVAILAPLRTPSALS